MRCKTVTRSPDSGEKEEEERDKRPSPQRAPTVRQTAGGRGRTA